LPDRAILKLLLVFPDHHVGAVAQLLDPDLVGFLGALPAHRLARRLAQPLGRSLVAAPGDDLNQVQPEGRAHYLADLAGLERIHGARELGHGSTRINPAKVAATPRAAIARVLAGHVLEACAAGEPAPARRRE